MAEICHRSRKPVYAADNPVRIGSLCFNPNFFTCKFKVAWVVVVVPIAFARPDLWTSGPLGAPRGAVFNVLTTYVLV